MATVPSVAVVYLARCAEGPKPLQRFLESYRQYPTGIDHQLVVIFKGYDQQVALAAARALFSGTPHLGVEIDDLGLDIGAYLEAARRLPHAYFCFLNSFTEIAAPAWLALLHERATEERVGIVGAMGVYESHYDSNRLLHKIAWLCNDRHIAYDPAFHYYFQFFVEEHCRRWCAQDEHPLIEPTPIAIVARPSQHRPTLIQKLRERWLDERFNAHLRSFESSHWTTFPRFPNPHIRTNGFMLRADRLLPFEPEKIRSKEDSYSFESGADGLTARLRRAGLSALLIGRDGQAFDVADWPRSTTYRLGDQANLLLHDNQSRGFEALGVGSRHTLARLAWGDFQLPPVDFPDLRLEFRRQPL
jgi:hypothetical protein